MIIHVPPGSPAVIKDGAALILALHIGGGSISVLSGAAALLLPKGGAGHRLAGDVFVVSMLIMAGIGAAVSPFLPTPQPGNVVVGVLACYLVATGWAAARSGGGGFRGLERAAALVLSLIVAAALIFGVQALSRPGGEIAGAPYQDMFVFAAVGGLLAICDVSVIVRGPLPRAQRIARHLWRMCIGLFIATGSALAQPKLTDLAPPLLRQAPILLLPLIAIVVAMIYWLVRTGVADGSRTAHRRMAGTTL